MKIEKFRIKSEKVIAYIILTILIISLISVMIVKGASIDVNIRETFESLDLTTTINENSSYQITFVDDEIIAPDNVEVLDNVVRIEVGGTYVISGWSSDAIIYIEARKQVVTLVLDNLNLTSTTSSPIIVENAKKVFINLKTGTNNTLMDTTNHLPYLNASEEEILTSGCLFSRDNLTINGSGTLTINGNYCHGIDCKDILKITGGNIIINALNNGIEANDAVEIMKASITINSGNDGINVKNTADSSLGYVSIISGIVDINSYGDGIFAASTLGIAGGTVTINAGVGNTNTKATSGKGLKSVSAILIAGGVTNITSKDDGIHADEYIIIDLGEITVTSGNHGLKSGKEIIINDGKMTITSSKDSLHSEKKITINDGEITIDAKDDGIRADSKIKIKGGIINIDNSYEGIESLNVLISGGTTYINSSDDGININCAESGMGQQTNTTTTSSGMLKITGGFLYVDADGDGLDSNDSILITGGITLVCGPTTSANGPLDYGSKCKVTGGILIAAGSSGMSQNISSSSSQCGVLVNFSSTYAANKLICITDSKGRV
ncbi:MAG: carbohydrate-binding domain-containing protein, partial [Bacilli bacterium]|nr:carbohydrate-binding domain-containing protein [Bacilli bacterium]